METKFTKDGRKVAVVGKLNKTQYIVQEIFVTENGDEFPQGENFTVDSVFDEKVESHKDREIKTLNDNIEKAKKSLDSINHEIKQFEQRRTAAAEIMKQIDCTIKELPNFDFDFFCDFACGNFKYAISLDNRGRMVNKGSHYEDPIDVFARFERNSWNNVDKFDMVRLVSLLGKSNGNLEYGISRWSDGGDFSTGWVFFKTRTDLFNWLNEYGNKYHDDGSLTEMEMEVFKKAGFSIPSDWIQKWFNQRLQATLDQENSTRLHNQENSKRTLERLNKARVELLK